MKRQIIGIALLCAGGGAVAQSSTTLFGVVDLAYETIKTQTGRVSGLAPSGNSSSRIGFRGVEDMGGGLTASFWLEAALNPASGIGSSGTNTINQSPTNVPSGGLTFNRRSTVSIAGGWGELRMGRDYVPTFWNIAFYDTFGANGVGADLGLTSGAGFASTFVRASNSIAYFLPDNATGIYGQAMYALGNRASNQTQAVAAAYGASPVGTPDNGRYVGGRLGYAKGPINTSVAYARTTYAPGTNPVSVGGFSSTSGDFTDASWGGSYQLGDLKAMASYARQRASDYSAPDVHRTATVMALGAEYRIGVGVVLAEYSTVRLNEIGARGKKLSAGYVHNLSKRTAVYGTFARVTNSGGAAFDATSGSSGALPAVSGAANANSPSTGYEIGLRHAF